jgi:hypothetical protein
MATLTRLTPGLTEADAEPDGDPDEIDAGADGDLEEADAEPDGDPDEIDAGADGDLEEADAEPDGDLEVTDTDHDGDPDDTDCAPLDLNVHVGATEECNGHDDDCDGEMDEEFECLIPV